MRRRPWWLTADTPGRALVGLAFPMLLVLVNADRIVRRHGWLDIVFLIVLLGLTALALATLLAFRRHPDWIVADWAPSRGGQWWAAHGLAVLRGLALVGALMAVAGIALVVTGGGAPAATLMAVGLLVAVAGGARGAAFRVFGPREFRDAGRPRADRSDRADRSERPEPG